MHDRLANFDTLSWTAIGVGLLGAVGAIAHFVALGYGSAIDTFGMLRTWQNIIMNGVYAPSRFQGSPIAEFLIGAAAGRGGYVLSNLQSLALSLIGLGALVAILRSYAFGWREAALVVAITATNPYWIIAAGTSDDGSYGLAFYLVGLWLITRRLPVLAAIALAAAGGSRLGYAPLGLLVLLLLWWAEREQRALHAQALAVYAITGALLYLPAFIHSKLTLAFLHPAYPDLQGLTGLVARAVYKTGRLFGFVGGLSLIIIMWLLNRRRQTSGGAEVIHPVAAIAWLTLGYHLLMFLRIPAEVNYLLACVPAVAVLLVCYGANARQVGPLVAIQVFYWFVAVEPLRIAHLDTGPCGAVIATGARFEPHLEPGVLVSEARAIERLAPCYFPGLLVPPRRPTDPLPSMRYEGANAAQACRDPDRPPFRLPPAGPLAQPNR